MLLGKIFFKTKLFSNIFPINNGFVCSLLTFLPSNIKFIKINKFYFLSDNFFSSCNIKISLKNNTYIFYKKRSFSHITTGVVSSLLDISKKQRLVSFIMAYYTTHQLYKILHEIIDNQHIFLFKLPYVKNVITRRQFLKYPMYFRKYRRIKRWLYKSILKANNS